MTPSLPRDTQGAGSSCPFTLHSSLSCCVLCAVCFVLPGCADRRISITSEPPGALVHLNDTEVGRTPCEVNFTWFGVYDVRLEKEGFEPLITTAEARAPIHEWPGIDLAMMFIPVTKRTRIEWHFVLQPEQNDPDALLLRAADLRDQLLLPAPEPPPAD